jgi:hypothetical protein
MTRAFITIVTGCLIASACNAEPERPGPEQPANPITAHAEALTTATWRAAASKADRVAAGRVTHIAARRMITEHGFDVIASDVTLAVEDGSARTVAFTVLGGELDGIRLDVSHTPRFERGGRYLVLLAKRQDGALQITGGELGGLAIDDNNRVSALDTSVAALTADLGSVR